MKYDVSVWVRLNGEKGWNPVHYGDSKEIAYAVFAEWLVRPDVSGVRYHHVNDKEQKIFIKD